MNILIIGAGSIGSLFGALLAQQDHEVYVYGNENLKNYLQHNILKYLDLQSQLHEIPKLQYCSSSTISSHHNSPFFDIIMIATKAYNLTSVCQEHQNFFQKQSIVFLLQNGLGNAQILARNFPQLSIYRIITTNGAKFIPPGTVVHTGKGYIQMCLEYSPNHNQLQKTDICLIERFLKGFKGAGYITQYHGEDQRIIWQKTIVNLSINAFGALTRKTNGELLSITDLHQYMKLIISEALSIAVRFGIHLESSDYYMDQVIKVLTATALNTNSMLQDILNQKPTEIDFLNGKIAQFGKKFEILTPINALITSLIKTLEKY